MAPRQGTGLINTIKSALAAAMGVQSSANRNRDFEHGRPMHFIIAGILVTLLFIGVIVLMVSWMIASNS
ncbi:MAG: DUF2970 domain-containing protein [Pseudomonadota bacterium]